MSFILDALKKAESERNRHVAPVLMDARIAPYRRGLPPWAWILGAVLVLNLAVLAWLLNRTRAPQDPDQAASAAALIAPQTAAPVPAVPPAILPSPAPSQTPPVQPANEVMTAVEAPALPPHSSGPSLAATGDEERLPSLQELRNAGVPLPELALNLHVYAPAPASRSVLLNGQRAREGEYLPNGVKVERITPQAVILEASGRRFRLAAAE